MRIFGDNSRTRYGSDGVSSTQAFGNNYRHYYYHVIDKRVTYARGRSYEVGFLFFKQDRTVIHRYTDFYRLTYSKDGTLVKEQFLYTMHEQDFEAKGSLFGSIHKQAFKDPTGFGAFYTDFVEEVSQLSISVGGSIGGGKGTDRNPWGSAEFFVHYNEESAIQASERLSQQQLERTKLDLASDIRVALSDLNNQLRKSDSVRTIMSQLGISIPESDSSINIINGYDDSSVIQTTIQAGGTDLLALGADNVSKIIDVYNKVDKSGINLNLISTTNRSYSIQVGKQYTAEYLMEFAKDAIVLPSGSYEITDVDIVQISSTDQFGNPYGDPDGIYLNVPVAEIIIYLNHRSAQ